MGVLTLAEFETEISAGLGNRQDISTARIVNVLNLAQSRIGRAYDFSEMATVSFAAMSFTSNPALDKYMIPPPRTKTIHSFVCLDTSSNLSSMGQSRKVIEKPWRWFDSHYPAPEWVPAGWPIVYKRWGNIIVMVPAPFLPFTAQLSFTTFATPFVVGAQSQTSDFENKDDLLISYSLAYFFKTLGRPDRAAYFEALSKEQLDEAIDKDDTRPDIEVSRDVPALGGVTQGPYWADPLVTRAPG
jgi:hypothetical protein